MATATAAMTSVAGPSTLRIRPGGKRAQSDAFRPKFPLDPFANLKSSAPWLLDADALLFTTRELRRQVVLVLGDLSYDGLQVLLCSPHFEQSLVIVPSPSAPLLPSDVRATVRILRQAAPKSGDSNISASNLGDILQWAERVARVWRRHGGSGTHELTDGDDGGGLVDTRTRTPSDPAQRPLDAIVHFLPSDAPEKTLLKQAVFVSGMAQPFLMSKGKAPVRPSPLPTPSGSTQSLEATLTPKPRRSSLLKALSASSSSLRSPRSPLSSSGSSSTSLPGCSPLAAHLVHVLPASIYSRTRLIENIESFVLSLSAPPPPSSPSYTPSKARPYVLSTSTFCSALPAATQPGPSNVLWTIADAVLCGALDGAAGDSLASCWAAPRAFIRSADEIASRPAGDITPPPSARVRVRSELFAPPRGAVDLGASLARKRPAARVPPTLEEVMSEEGARPPVAIVRTESGASVREPGLVTPATSEESCASEASSVGEGAGSGRSGSVRGWRFWRVRAA